VSWTCGELRDWCGGKLAGDAATRVEGISTDSRTLRPGDLFVCLSGPSFDGHDFAEDAVARGARALLVARDEVAPAGVPSIRVGDTLEALAALAAAHRAGFEGPVIAITGSNGKTSTKEMCAEILAAEGLRVRRTPGNLNNEIGLPLSVLGLRAGDDALVVELGMNHPGEIDRLARIASPDVGAITQVAAAHVGEVGSIEAIARAKGELFDRLRPNGTAVLNADDPRVMAQAERFRGARVRFAVEAEAEFSAHGIRSDGAGTRFGLRAPAGEREVRIASPGRHLVHNALCAAACASASGRLTDDPLGAIERGLAAFAGVPGRLSLRELGGGVRLLDDSYNSNPVSALAALRALRDLTGDGRSIATLADMLELGDEAPALHAEVGRAAAELGVDVLLAVGPLSTHTAAAARDAGLADVREADDADTAGDALRTLARPGDAVLVKGSRSMRMERAIARLQEEAR
jgi:UDP-N-acetylmuramoyl-tripeptide--D-alanyl-D-alanine ligase